MRTPQTQTFSSQPSSSLRTRLWSLLALACAILALSPGTSRAANALFVYAGAPMGANDLAVSNRLVTLGYRVQAVLDAASATAMAATNDLIVVSSTVGSGNLVANGVHKFLDTAKPLINWESANFDDLRMTSTAGGQFGGQGGQTSVNIVRANHPMAAGLALGTNVIFNSAQTVAYGVPLANATVIARQVGDNSRAVLFAYDRGDVLFGGVVAAERRIGVPLDNNLSTANTNGLALFDAAVRWAIPANPAPVFVSEPADATVIEARSASFSVEANGARPFSYQWLKNNTPIAGATGRSLTLPTTLSDNGATISVRVTNASGSVTSKAAKLTVTEDKTPPTILSVVAGASGTEVTVSFSEPLLPATALNLPNYAFIPSVLNVTAARLTADGQSVVLTTTPQTPGAVYTLRVFSVRDASAALNSVAPGTEASFSAWVLSRGALSFEVFNDVDATNARTALTNLTSSAKFINNAPDFTGYLSAFNTRTIYPTDINELYGARVSGYYTPPSNGLYRFFIRSDDASQFFMNTNSANSVDPSKKVLLAKEDACCNAFGSTAAGGPRVSPDISLTGGQRYYVEALLKEGTGGDFVQVAVREKAVSGNPPDSDAIPGIYLSTLANPDGAAITITEQPASVSVGEGGGASATFRVAATAATLASTNQAIAYQWQRNGVDIAGANGSSYTTAAIPSNNGAKYRAVLMIPGRETTSAEATLTVTPDTTAPSVVSAGTFTRPDKVTVTFSEPVNAASATKIENYALNNGVRVSGATQTAPNTVELNVTTAPAPSAPPAAAQPSLAEGLVAHLTFDGDLKDSSGSGNNGTSVGTTTIGPGKVGSGALVVNSKKDGTSFNYVTLGTPSSLNMGTNTDFTVSLWANYTKWEGDPAFISNKDWNSGGNIGFVVSTHTDGRLQWNYRVTGGAARKDYDGPAGTFTGGGWHHVVVSFARNGDAKSYVDGKLVNATAIGPTTGTLDAGLPINIGQDGTGKYTDGNAVSNENALIDDVAIWKRVLSEADVQGIFSAGSKGQSFAAPAIGAEQTLVGIDANQDWRYENSGQDLGTAWKEKGFNDGAWKVGKALLAFETGATVEPIRTQLVRTKAGSTANDIVTDYFRTHFTFNGDPATTKLIIRHVVDDGVALYLNGKEVYRFFLPETGPITAATLAVPSDHENKYEGPFEIPASALLPGDNVLAAEVHQNSATSSDIVFGLELKAVSTGPPSGGLLAGLVGSWHLDEISGEVVADSSGKGNNGKIINSTAGAWVEDATRGRVFKATGQSVIDFGTILPAMSLTNNFTWSLWVKSDVTDNDNIVFGNRYKEVSAAGAGADFAPREFIKLTPRQFEWHVNGTGQNLNYTDFVVGQWAHHAVVKQGNTLAYYLNGQRANTNTITGAPTNRQSLFLGGQGTLERWTGLADEVAIFERGLSAADVKQLYDAGKSLERPVPTPINTAGLRITVNGVQDLAEKANTIAANAQLLVSNDPATPPEFGQFVNAYQDDFSGTTLNPNWRARNQSTNTLYTLSNGALRVVTGPGDPNHLLYEAPGYSASNQEVLARVRVVAFGPSGDGNSRAGIAVAVGTNSQGINLHFRDANQTDAGTTINGRQLRLLDDLRNWGPGADFRPVGANRWVTNQWYWMRVKHQLDPASGRADAYGKAWSADGTVAEPADWQITWRYPASPVRSGFAGIAASIGNGIATFDVDYVLIKAAGLSTIKVGGSEVKPPQALLVTGATPSAGDAVVANVLAGVGYKVTSVTAPASQTGNADGKDVIVVSSTVSSGDMLLNGVHKFRDVAVPIMNWESASYDDLAMTGTAATEFGTTANVNAINIINASHPLAGGLPAGTNIVFLSPQTVTWGIPLANAIVVAVPTTNPKQALIFGYERDDALFGGIRAAERRLGFYLGDTNATVATPATAALAAAALDWLNPANPAVRIVSEPADTTAVENLTASFSVEANGLRPFTYQWFKNNAAIEGATTRRLSAAVTMADNGSTFSVRVTNPTGSVTSRSAKLTITADKAAPVVLSAVTRGNPNGITVAFSEPVNEDTALDPANYAVSGGVFVQNVFPGRDNKTVVVSTTSIPDGKALTLTVKDVADQAAVPNKIAPNPTTLAINTGQGVLAMLVFDNLTGTGVADLTGSAKYKSGRADSIEFLSSFNTRTVYPTDAKENYGAWIAGYFTPPSNGVYRFFIRSDDASQLYMSTNNASSEDPSKKVLIAKEDGCCNAYGGTAAGGPRVSPNIAMNGGQRYWIEAFLKEGGGGDYLQVAFRERAVTGNPPDTDSIPGAYLTSPIPSAPIALSAQPTGVTAAELGTATLSVLVSGTPPYGYQWYRDGVAIAGANRASYTIPKVTLGTAKESYSVAITNGFSVVASDGVSVTVTPDTTSPTIVSASGGPSLADASITFSEAVDSASASVAANYSLSGGLSVTAAKVAADGRTVILTTGAQKAATEYTVTVTGVKDTAGAGNAITPGSRVSFVSLVPASGFLLREVYASINGTVVSDLTGNAKYPNSPDLIDFASTFEAPSGFGDNYGVRLSGFVTAPQTGNYVFYISADDQAQLFLSTDENPVNKRLIANEPQWNDARQWVLPDRRTAANPENRSAPIALTAGRRYFVEALMKEGGGGDHLGVTWRLPNATAAPTNGAPVIQSAFLSTAASPVGSAITFIQQPQSTTVDDGKSATLTVAAKGITRAPASPTLHYQWQRNGTNIAGATGGSYTTPVLRVGDNANYRVVLRIPGNETVSQDAAVTVVRDTTLPAVVSANTFSRPDRVTVVFSESVGSSAMNPGNYTINNSVKVASVTQVAPNSVELKLGVSPRDTIKNGLAAYWNFDGTLSDSVRAAHGTSRGTPAVGYVDGKGGFGKAIQLTGTNYVEITGSSNTLAFANGSLSIAGWFKVDAFDKSWQALISKGEQTSYRIARRGTGNNIAYAGGFNEGVDDVPVITNGWHHFVAVTDATGAKFGTALYVDGAIYGINTNRAVLAAGTSNLLIGENPGALNRQWRGAIDDVALWNRVLTPDEIGALYNGGTGTALKDILSPPAQISILGIGASALLGGSLTDPDGNGLDALGGATSPTWDWAGITSSHEPDFEGGENSFNIFDHKVGGGNDKWCCDDPIPGRPVWVAVQFRQPISLTHFTVASGNDTPTRDPTDWAIQGSNDGTTYSDIYRFIGTPVPWTERNQVVKFTLPAASPAYTYIRYIAYDTPATLHQINEIEYFGTRAPAALPAAAAASTIGNGLVSYWNFEGNLLDSARTAHGTSRGTTPVGYVDGKAGLGKAIQLNGTNFVEITGSSNTLAFANGSVSIAGWFKVDAFDKSWQALISKGEQTSYRIARRGTGNNIAYAGGIGEGVDNVPVITNGWHHFVAVTDATTAKFGTALYVDGVIYGINTNKAVLAAGTSNLLIGENPGALGRQWKGAIDDVALWDRVLTADEVSLLYNGGTGVPLSERLNPTPVFITPGSFYVLTVAGVQDAAGNTIRSRSRILIDTEPALPADFGLLVNGYQDDFTGTTLASAWRARGPSTNIYSVRNGMLSVTNAAGDPNHLLYEATYNSTNQEVLARIRVLRFGADDAARAGIGVGVATNSQGINLHFRNFLQDGVAGKQFKLLDDNRAWGPAGYKVEWATNTWYWLRLKQAPDLATGGFDIFGKAWLGDGTALEPADWNLRWDRYPAASVRSGFAGITGGSIAGISQFDVDYILIKAAGLPAISAGGSQINVLSNRRGGSTVQLFNTRSLTDAESGRTVVFGDERTGEGFLSISKLDNDIVVEFKAVPGRSYRIQASNDLRTWTEIGESTANAQGRGLFLDPDSANIEQRFYRTLSP